MKYAYTILFADNKLFWVAPRIELLQSAGYRVIPAASVEESQKIMDEEHVHLAILDIRLIDDDDQMDVSGLTLAKDPRFHTIPKIIYTSYPKLETMREALWFPLIGMPVAVDYITKDISSEKFLETVEIALRERVHINERLLISHLKSAKSIDSQMSDLETGLDRSRRTARIDEMEDLFRSVFYDYQHLTISRFFWNTGGRFALEALASKDGGEESFLVVAGLAGDIQKELSACQKLLPKSSKTGSLAFFTAESVHYALRALPLLTGKSSGGEIQTLGEFYQSHSASQTKEVIGELFGSVLAPWRQRNPDVREVLVDDYYRQRLNLPPAQLTKQEFQTALERLNQECNIRGIAEFTPGPESWSLRVQKGSPIRLGNPLVPLYLASLSPRRVRLGLCAGSLSIENVLVDQERRVLLSDYASVDQKAPTWDDFVTLEHSVRMANTRYDLPSLLDLEKSLLAAGRLGELVSLDDVDGELKKAANLILTIRQEAADLKEFELLEYLWALYFYTVRDLLEYTGQAALPTPYLKEYACQLAAAGLISAKLTELSHAPLRPASGLAASASLSILDESTRQVLVGERPVTMTKQEFSLFKYLFDRAGKVCLRTDIFKELFNVVRPSDSDESMLTQNIRRIRVKIEANPAQPVYLHTERDIGIKLVILPE